MGSFVTFEGPEGSGKTTQIALLESALCAMGYDIVCTREPGGTSIGEQVRAVLHSLDNQEMLPRAEILLYSAARAQHVGELIAPSLARGCVVLCDRYAESTLAYQGYGHGLDLEDLGQITRFATEGLRPSLIVYLDLDVTVGLQRKRVDHDHGSGEWNRMDQLELAFHQRVRDGYLQMAQQDPSRWVIVDAKQSIEDTHRYILSRLTRYLERHSHLGSR